MFNIVAVVVVGGPRQVVANSHMDMSLRLYSVQADTMAAACRLVREHSARRYERVLCVQDAGIQAFESAARVGW